MLPRHLFRIGVSLLVESHRESSTGRTRADLPGVVPDSSANYNEAYFEIPSIRVYTNAALSAPSLSTATNSSDKASTSSPASASASASGQPTSAATSHLRCSSESRLLLSLSALSVAAAWSAWVFAA